MFRKKKQWVSQCLFLSNHLSVSYKRQMDDLSNVLGRHKPCFSSQDQTEKKGEKCVNSMCEKEERWEWNLII